MKDDDVCRVTRWIDDEVKDSEISDLLAENPSLQEDRRAAREIGNWLRQELPAECEVPFPRVFSRQIMKRIEEQEQKTARQLTRRFFSWLTDSEWGVPVAASAVLVVLLAAGLPFPDGKHFRSRVVHTFTPNPAHSARTGDNAKAGVAVITIKGLAPLPEATQVMGYFPTRSSREAAVAATTIFYEGRRPALLLSMSASGQPRLDRLR